MSTDAGLTLILVMNYFGLGGAERRMFNYANHLHSSGRTDVRLVLNRALHGQVLRSGLLRAGGLPLPLGLARALPRDFGLSARALAVLDRLLIRRALARLGRAGRVRAAYAIVGGVEYLGLFPGARKVAAFVDPALDAARTPAWLALPQDTVVDAASERLAAALAETPAGRGRDIRVSPCTFIDYERVRVLPKESLVAFSGRLSPEKQPELFLRAAALVLRRAPGIRFAVMGAGPQEDFLRRLAGELGLADALRIGFVPDPGETLARAAVFCSLQRDENYHSQALLEAMAAQCGVVATDVGLTRRMVDETTGVPVPPDPARVAEAVLALLADPAQREALGRAADARARTEHSVERFDAHVNEMTHFHGG